MYIREWELAQIPNMRPDEVVVTRPKVEYRYTIDGHKVVITDSKRDGIVARATFEDEITGNIFEFPWANVVKPKEVKPI